MSVVADVQEVFACAGHAVIEKHEQEHEPAAVELLTRNSGHVWPDSLADRLHVHGWEKKDVFMNCQRWCLEISGNVHAGVPMEIGWPWPVSWTAQEDHWGCG